VLRYGNSASIDNLALLRVCRSLTFCSSEHLMYLLCSDLEFCVLRGPPPVGSVRGEKKKKTKFYGLPTARADRLKNLYTKSERLTVSCRVNWVWRERVNLYHRPTVILPRNMKTYATLSDHGSLYRLQPPAIGSGVMVVTKRRSSEGARFEFRPRHRLPWLFLCFHSSFRIFLGFYRKVSHDHLISCPSVVCR